MIDFWLAAGLLLLIALSFILIPVLRARRAQREEDRTALNVALYQERVAELQAQPERFAELAGQYSNCPSGAVGGSLGQLARGQCVPEFDELLFRLQPGELSGRLLETRFPDYRTFDPVRGVLSRNAFAFHAFEKRYQ